MFNWVWLDEARIQTKSPQWIVYWLRCSSARAKWSHENEFLLKKQVEKPDLRLGSVFWPVVMQNSDKKGRESDNKMLGYFCSLENRDARYSFIQKNIFLLISFPFYANAFCLICTQNSWKFSWIGCCLEFRYFCEIFQNNNCHLVLN